MKRQFINTLIFCSQRTTVFRAYSFSPSFYCRFPCHYFSLQKKDKYNFYNDLKIFLKNKPINENTQKEIEEFLLNSGFHWFDDNKEINNIPINFYSFHITKLLLPFKSSLINKIKNFIKNNKKVDEFYLVTIIEEVGISFVLTILFGRFIKILSSCEKNLLGERNQILDIALDLSEGLIREYFYCIYNKEKENKEHYFYSNWKEDNGELISKFDDILRVRIGAILIEWLEDCNLITKKLINVGVKKYNVCIPASSLLEEIKNSENTLETGIISSPIRLPLIVPPKQYILDENNNVKLGGYLLNDVKYADPLILPNYRLSKKSIIKKKNIIYDVINKINSVGYKINVNMLNFIERNPHLFDKELVASTHPFQNKKKLTKKEKIVLQKHFSNLDMQTHILNIAETFSVLPEFFFVSRIDNRGRIYCVSEYLNFQSNDLAKSLLLFSKPNNINRLDSELSILYFKGYGGNCFGGKIAKASLEDKAKWVDSNLDEIINFEKNTDIINQAENKLLFSAFCFEFKRWYDFSLSPSTSEFKTYFPIQLDASCNGFQHLVLLSGDTNLRKELNLTSSKVTDKPFDFYSYVLEALKDYLNKIDADSLEDDEKNSYKRIKNFCLDRKIIKKMIMTIPYNATSRTIVSNMVSELHSEWEIEGNIKTQWLSTFKDDFSNKITTKDLHWLVKIIKKLLDELSPKIQKLKQYLKQISIICTKLEIHIPWLLPTGLKVRQSYTEEKIIKIKPFCYSKTAISLSSFSKKLDLNKQTRSFMPNLIHSLDSSSLILLLDKYFSNEELLPKSIYCIHDCFAMPMNHVEFIINTLRMVYTTLYSDVGYLKKLDEGIISTITLHYKTVEVDRERNLLKITQEGDVVKTFDYPNIKEVVGESLPKLENNINYIII